MNLSFNELPKMGKNWRQLNISINLFGLDFNYIALSDV